VDCDVRYNSHHRSHAAAGYFTSGFDNATVLCIDAIGEFETLTVWEAEGNDMYQVWSQKYPHSIGLWYSAMTQRIGLKPNEDEYILMGMAAYGDKGRLYHSILDEFIDVKFKNNKLTVRLKQNLHRGCKNWRPDLKTEQDMYDIAAATQLIYEQSLLEILLYCKYTCKSKNLVLMGGCALNCSANSKAHNLFDNVWIMPNPSDAGSAVGAVLSTYNEHIEFKSPYLGYNIEGKYPVEKTLNALLSSGICGVANGRAEYGPRALGNRSLFADPRGEHTKDRVNDIKQRQKFRPFAPVVLEEHARELFDGPMGPYMQYTARCKDTDKYPAIAHVDGTSRVQVVNKKLHTGLYELLRRWKSATGCPMLLNTSLNIKGKPMVNDKVDAKEFALKYGVSVY
jgi:carbamoyltransferase